MSSKGQKDGAFSFLQMDLSGKLIIKARLGDDFRRVPIHNEDITYDELLLMLQRVFKGKLSNSDDVTLKYCDEEGDLITICDSSDLNLAKQISRQLKISIFVHGKQPLPTLDASEVQEVRKELVAIRDKVNTLLDALDGTPRGQGRISVSLSGGRMGSESKMETNKQTTPTAAPMTVPRQDTKPGNGPTTSLGIFDPLKPTSQSSAPVATSSAPTNQQQQGSTSHLFSQQTGGSGTFLTSQSQAHPQQQQQPGYHTSGYPSTAIPQTSPGQVTQQQQHGQVTQQQPGQVGPYAQPSQGYDQAQKNYPSSQAVYPTSQPSAPTPTPPPTSQVPTHSQYPPGSSYPAAGTPQSGFYGFQGGQPPPPSATGQTGYSGFTGQQYAQPYGSGYKQPYQ